MKTFRAPWGKTLFWVSLVFTTLCVGGAALTLGLTRDFRNPAFALLPWLPVLLPLGCLPFVVRGYGITADAILIRRLFWSTRFERSGLLGAEVAPHAMRGSIRTCGNGGAYSFTGWYWCRRIGVYRAFVNDLNRTVILRFRKRTILVSPENPEEFVAALAVGNPAPEEGGETR